MRPMTPNPKDAPAPDGREGAVPPRTGGIRRRLTRAGGLLFVLAICGSIYAALAPGSTTASASDNAAVNEGKALFVQGCAACHGLDGQGSSQGPSLVGVGAAAADFQVANGFMPLKYHGAEATKHRVTYTDDEITDISEYVATFGPGPAIPSAAYLAKVQDSDVAFGGALFRTDCAQCHNFAGSGGALTYGKSAPSLSGATPTTIYEAMITGPEQMPVFGNQEITPSEKLAIINYITTIKSEPDPGGFSLGRVGPVTEGLVAWVLGMGVLVLTVIWIGSRS